MKKFVLIAILCVVQTSVAQPQDAFVFFADKENVQASIDNPLTILTQEAIDRKAMHDVVIDERDVPVTPAYIDALKNATGITVVAKSKWMNCVYVQGTQGDIENLLNLSFVTGVEWLDKDLNTFPVPDGTEGVDDKFAIEKLNRRIEYDYGAAANQIEMIRGDFLHQEDFTGEGMIIAILDSGFPGWASNPAFTHVIDDDRLLGTFDFVSRTTNVTGTGSHGVKTSSDIAGFIENEFVGTAPNASFYLFRTEYGPDENPREEAWWVAALERADSLGVDVINTSLGYQDYDNPNYDHSYEDLDGQTTFAARGANIALEKGMLLVTSAGNDGNGFGTVGTPGDAVGIFTVGAVNSEGEYVSFSSRGPTVDGRVKPDVMAQGADAAVVAQNGNVVFNNGTSFSSPILAGAITCLWQSRPEIKNFKVMRVVRETASMYENPTDEMGYGIPNFEDAYNALQILGVEEQILEENFVIYPNPVKNVFNLSFPLTAEKAQLQLLGVAGNLVWEQEVFPSENQIDISFLPSGMYLARVIANGVSNSFKIVKQ